MILILPITVYNSPATAPKCWCNYLHNILPNINYQLGFIISRVDALYVSIKDRFLCMMSISQSRKPPKTNTLFSHFKDNTLHTIQKLERKTHRQAYDLKFFRR